MGNQEKKKRLLEKNRKRQHALEEARRIDRMSAKKINDERIAREEMVARNAAGRYSADMVKRTKEELRKKDKLENIERMRRIDEFVRLQTLQKIALDEERTLSLKKQKHRLLLQRKEQATKQRVTKARLATAIDHLRKTQEEEEEEERQSKHASAAGSALNQPYNHFFNLLLFVVMCLFFKGNIVSKSSSSQ